jgi:hypothetical protein
VHSSGFVEKVKFSRTARELFVGVKEVHGSEALYSIHIGLPVYVPSYDKFATIYRVIMHSLTPESWIKTNFTPRLCGLVVRVSGYRSRGPGFDPRRFQIF